jgi:hypothetical protein
MAFLLLTSSGKRRHIANRDAVEAIHGDVLFCLEEADSLIDGFPGCSDKTRKVILCETQWNANPIGCLLTMFAR